MRLLKNAEVYAPAHIGRRDILIEGNRIAAIEPSLSAWEGLPGVVSEELGGAALCPGLIDLHVHVTGGGGEDGPASRAPEIMLSQLTENGVTTVVGLLGTDGVTRSPEALLGKVRALEEEGITAYMLTGSYGYPSITITGGVERDIALIDRVIGVKAAVSDHRGSNITVEELIRLGTQARRGGMLGGKPGLVTLHMGDGREGMDPVFQALERSDIPAEVFLPTHVGRTKRLTEEAVAYTQMGGRVDFTASGAQDGTGTAAKVLYALERGADPARITMSSDSGGSLPVFDRQGRILSMGYATPSSLLRELRRFVKDHGMELSGALRFFTENAAAVLGKQGRKGCIAVGADADLITLTPELAIDRVYAGGRKLAENGRAAVKGYFEA